VTNLGQASSFHGIFSLVHAGNSPHVGNTTLPSGSCVIGQGFAQAYLETEFDIEEYLAKLRTTLVAIVKDGYKVRIG